MNEAFTKKRLLDALEYIDDEYIASAARYKMKIKPHASEPPVQTVGGSLKKYWKQYLGLVACLLIVALASPLFILVAQNITSLLAGAWSGTTDVINHTETPDITDEFTHPETPDTTEYRTETENDTDVNTTTELHESVLTPNYLKFVPDLEPILEELMLEIRNAWSENRYEYWYDYHYKFYSAITTEEEAVAMAKRDADIAARDALYDWFVLSIYNDRDDSDTHKYRYYGQVADYVVLVNYRTETYNYSDEIINKKIGGHTFYFERGGEIYLYKDGVFETMEEVYERGLISDEDVEAVADRHRAGYEACYKNWKNEEYSKYWAEQSK